MAGRVERKGDSDGIVSYGGILRWRDSAMEEFCDGGIM